MDKEKYIDFIKIGAATLTIFTATAYIPETIEKHKENFSKARQCVVQKIDQGADAYIQMISEKNQNKEINNGHEVIYESDFDFYRQNNIEITPDIKLINRHEGLMASVVTDTTSGYTSVITGFSITTTTT